MLPARKDVDAEHDARAADEERVVVVARASRLLGVVAEFGAFLVAEDGLHGVVGVDDVGEAKHGVDRLVLVAGQPRVERLAVGLAQGPPHGVLRNDPTEAEQFRRRGVVPERVDLDITCPCRTGWRAPLYRRCRVSSTSCCSCSRRGSRRRGCRRAPSSSGRPQGRQDLRTGSPWFPDPISRPVCLRRTGCRSARPSRFRNWALYTRPVPWYYSSRGVSFGIFVFGNSIITKSERHVCFHTLGIQCRRKAKNDPPKWWAVEIGLYACSYWSKRLSGKFNCRI